jgi:hypothetical protein
MALDLPLLNSNVADLHRGEIRIFPIINPQPVNEVKTRWLEK